MNILTIGGTRFAGRFFVELAVAAGHAVTTFNRGRERPEGINGARNVIGDRASDIERAGTAAWDAVVDMCGMLPRDVAKSVHYVYQTNPGATYLFISSVSAYSEACPPDSDERGPLRDAGDRNASSMTPETYGALKVACEHEVQAVFAQTATVVRPGLIVGPNDPSDRFTYWVRRAARGGHILAPGSGATEVEVIDARDLAHFLLACVERKTHGVFNATGPAHTYTMGDVLETCLAVAASAAHVQWVPEAFLVENGVEPWSEMPLWIPAGQAHGIDTIDSRKAVEHGLRNRKLRDTVRDTLAWDHTRDGSLPLKAGITPERERELLERFARLTSP